MFDVTFIPWREGRPGVAGQDREVTEPRPTSVQESPVVVSDVVSDVAPDADGGTVSDADAWVAASPRLVRARIVTALVVTPLPIAAGVVLATLVSPWWWFLAAPFALGLASTLLRSRRRVAALGYAERAEELVVREGLWSRTATVIPYGRLQYVTLTEGPIDTRYGLARLEVHTAAGGSTTVPGLPVAEARALRARLSRRTRGRDEGL